MDDIPLNLMMLTLSALLLVALPLLLLMGQYLFALVVAGCLTMTVGAASFQYLRVRPTSA